MNRLETLLSALTRLNLEPGEALSQQIAPLLYYASRETAAPALRKAYYETAARNVALLDALEEAASHLGAKGITPLVLKGGDLAASVYPNPALRPMNDIDLWVEPNELAVAEEVLLALGYRAGYPEIIPGLDRAIRHARLYVKGPNDSVAVDLHWSLIGHEEDRRVPDLSWFRKNSRGMRLDATAHLLYLAAHMKLQHYDESPSLLWLCDFYLLAHQECLRGHELLEAASAFGWTRALAATASEVEERLRLELPETLAPLLARTPAGHTLPDGMGGAEGAWNELSTLNWRGRAAWVRGHLLPSPSYIRWRYRPRPSWSWPFYYVIRWARMAGSVLYLAIHKIRRRPLLEESP